MFVCSACEQLFSDTWKPRGNHVISEPPMCGECHEIEQQELWRADGRCPCPLCEVDFLGDAAAHAWDVGRDEMW